jgi:hypothetical protein
MSKTWEHYQGAAQHHERAAYQFKEAAKYHEAEEHEKAAHHAYLAHGHTQHALIHERAAARLYVEKCDGTGMPTAEQTNRKKSVA